MKPHVQTIHMKPVPKGRPRMTRRGRVFTPPRTLAAEDVIREQYSGDRFEGDVVVACVFTKDSIELMIMESTGTTSKLRGDLDNYVKLLMDGLNGIAWTDDKQVHQILAVKI